MLGNTVAQAPLSNLQYLQAIRDALGEVEAEDLNHMLLALLASRVPEEVWRAEIAKALSLARNGGGA